MVIGRVATSIVPDEAAWSVWGHDLAAAGFTPAASPERATVLLVPDPLPEPLLAAARDAWNRMPGRRTLVPLAALLSGGSARAVTHPEHPHHAGTADDAGGGGGGHGDMHHEAAGHDAMGHGGHGDMMAIAGPASSDGLVMEDVTLRVGPLSPSLPGGLIAELTLDGDIVSAAELRATLSVSLSDAAAGRVPDPLTPAGWQAAFAGAAQGIRTGGLAAVESERVRSHAAWLRSLGRVVGSIELREVGDALLGGPPASAQTPALTDRALRALGGRWLRGRLQGLAVVSDSRGLRGPNVRATGVAQDARAADPGYVRLGFAPVIEDGGDALARTLVRVREIAQSADLVRRDTPGDGRAAAGPVEGPRGPLRAIRTEAGFAVAAPGARQALAAAGSSVVGLELASAIASLVSFDLSPWRVGR